MDKPHFKHITLIGIGLIGSSIARDIRILGLADKLVVSTRRDITLMRAKKLDLGTHYTLSMSEAVTDADLIIISVPVGAYENIAKEIAPYLKADSIVTDVGSTKVSVISQIQPHIPLGVHFIPGHPIAGTEESGPDAGFSGLFRNRWCILTPIPNTNQHALDRVQAFWQALGSHVDHMDPFHHDQVLAIVSHLPHIIAYNMVTSAMDLETVVKSEVIKYSASGFRDFTRLAASDPIMWRDICVHNKDAILVMLDLFIKNLTSLKRMISSQDGNKLFEFFSHTRNVRRSIVEIAQDVDKPDFGRHDFDKT
ncbi:Cyclohexadienyl dehydrogenase [Liberibacter crescens BT-1]|uniref:prephenate dehydrogenase n=1 Tax=Liberibacter crescens (strain BT-1) TaxID=1215343 RepID=L0EXL9_LIBCB|nr:prephenate/arogenate dehydrogenase family protein [Liberibacter crescens]AGA65116.1 Cyclohexadienyl dehydrogenase [Liberibacter crescens BT-1]AMC13089.1 prephenate dehydrogenase [Liberibacter crescens]